MGRNGTRRLGTILMSVGLLLILSVAGYFAWTEVQAAQVRTELEQGAAAAAARATRLAAQGANPAASAAGGAQQERAKAVPVAAEGRASSTAAPKPVLLEPTAKPSRTPKASATVRAAATARVAPSSTPRPSSPTPAPAAIATVETRVLPVRMVVPDLKIDTKVVEMGWEVVQTKSGPVSQWVIPKNAAGHHINSAGLEQAENLVISGHNNIYGRVLMPISQAWNNDSRVKVDNYTDKSPALDGREISLFDAAGTQHNYVITEFYRLKDTGVSQQQREANGRFIMPTGDERVTIVTCWPPTNNTHRLVVIARPAE